MKRHVIALFLGIVLLLVSSLTLSCVPKTTASTAPTDGIAYKSDIAGLQGQITAQNQSINTIAGKSGVSSQEVQDKINSSLAGYAKTSDLDAAIAAYLVAHPVVATSTTSSTSSGTSTTSSGYIITLDRNQIISMSTETGNKDVSVTVVNQTGTSQNPSLLISLTPYSPSTFEVSKLAHKSLKSTLSGFTTAQDGIVQTNPDATTLLRKLYWVAPDFSLSSGSSKSIWLNFDVTTTDVVTWNLEIKAL